MPGPESNVAFCEWVGSGTPDIVSSRGRVHYKAVSIQHRTQVDTRIYNVGDPVIMAGEDQPWIAQIVDLFQVREDDQQLRQILRTDSRRNFDSTSYELMRCTLRWFYNYSDMDKRTLRHAHTPKRLSNEIWFSDHVEKDGYNDIQVIEGLAWLFSSKSDHLAFQQQPDPRFNPALDHIRIVRCFVNSKVEELPVRQLERGELKYLLENPSTSKEMFEKARLQMFGTSGAVLKGTGRKRKRHSTSGAPINVNLDEYEPVENSPNARFNKVEAKVELGLQRDASASRRSRLSRRRRIDDDDDDESADEQPSDHTDEKDDMPLSQVNQRDQQASKAKQSEVNEEVMGYVHELMQSVDDAPSTPPPISSSKEQPRNSSSKRKLRGAVTETIVIDDNEVEHGDGTPRNRNRNKTSSKHSLSASKKPLKPAAPAISKGSKPRPAFMPTARAKKKFSTEQHGKGKAEAPHSAHMRQEVLEVDSEIQPNESAYGTKGRSSKLVEKKPANKVDQAMQKKGGPSSSRRLLEKSDIRKGLSPTPPQFEAEIDEITKVEKSDPSPDEDFLSELNSAMENLRTNFSEIPKVSQHVLYDKLDDVLDMTIERMFDEQSAQMLSKGEEKIDVIAESIFGKMRKGFSKDVTRMKAAQGVTNGLHV